MPVGAVRSHRGGNRRGQRVGFFLAPKTPAFAAPARALACVDLALLVACVAVAVACTLSRRFRSLPNALMPSTLAALALALLPGAMPLLSGLHEQYFWRHEGGVAHPLAACRAQSA